jgi:prevent-host-death family protein
MGDTVTAPDTLRGHMTDMIHTVDRVALLRGRAMLREAPAMKVRQRLGELLNEVQYRGDSILVTKAGKPVAAIIDMELFNRLRLLEAEFDRLAVQLRAAYEGESPEVVAAEVDEALASVRGRSSGG